MTILFTAKNAKLLKIKEIPFKDEKEIQMIVEKNLQDILDLEFIKSEFALGNLRIDTLAFNNQNKAFTIIEYKKEKNFSVIDQGFAYLALLLNNKADFILSYNENKKSNLRKDDVDWSQSRIVFISPQFTKFQTQALNFQNLAFELYEINRYENDIIIFDRIKPSETAESINIISKSNKLVENINKEIKVYSEKDHLKNIPNDIKNLYEKLKELILDTGDNIEIEVKKHYIAFIANTNFVDVLPQQGQIKVWLNLKKGELKDFKNLARDVSNIGHWGNGDYEIILRTDDDFDYLRPLIAQSYKKHF
jgi:predicted transport protein